MGVLIFIYIYIYIYIFGGINIYYWLGIQEVQTILPADASGGNVIWVCCWS
ncbi:MAG: hypothetical protein N7Q72_01885 [Spiroplasma sp. Tabriz.8]|nr:hypothetical protein [Spiroplasma sp. Tabriz.8]